MTDVNKSDPVSEDTDPQVFLTGVRANKIVYLRLVGDAKLPPLLRELADQADTPLQADDGLLDAVGNDCFVAPVDFMLGLRSTFTLMPHKDRDDLPKIFSAGDLTLALFVSY